MPYDHNKKAGNEGDAVKHPALIAALSEILATHEEEVFRYADVFAGYAHNPLTKGAEWRRGAEKIWKAEKDKPDTAKSPAVKSWLTRYLMSRPQLLGGMYPGSSLIAFDEIARSGRKPHLAVWDTSPSCVADLLQVLPRAATNVHARKAVLAEADIDNADFILFDPPANRHWANIQEFITKRPNGQPFLVWLPLVFKARRGKKRQEVPACVEQLNWARNRFGLTKVVWGPGVLTKGCQLIYDLPAAATTALHLAVDEVARMADWDAPEHFPHA